MIPVIGDIIDQVGETVRKLIPDADKRAELEVQLAQLDQSLQLAQIGTNTEEAKSSNLFVAGWRPFIGWVCGGALGYTWILAPLLQWAMGLFGHQVPLPALAPEAIYPVVTAMLGIGAMRTFEKTKGVASSIGGVVMPPLLPTQPQSTDPIKTQSIPSKTHKWF